MADHAPQPDNEHSVEPDDLDSAQRAQEEDRPVSDPDDLDRDEDDSPS
ncbi:MAG: hypothetical protein QM639_19395 [Rhodocyclaceae bacterium]